MTSHPTSKRRRKRQELKERYMKVREDAQLADLVPTTPEGAVRNEAALTADVQLPELVRQGLRESWATPDCAKGAVVANLLEPFFREERPEPKILNELAKTLRLLDQTQFERDHPEEAGQAKGGIAIQNTLQAAQMVRDNLTDVDQIMALTKMQFTERTPDTPTENPRN